MDITPEQLESIQSVRKLTSAKELVLTAFEFGEVPLTAEPSAKQQKAIAAASSTALKSSGPPPKSQQPLLDGLEEEEAPPGAKPPEIKPCGQLDQPVKRTYRKHRRYKRPRKIAEPLAFESLAKQLSISLNNPAVPTARGTALVLLAMAELEGDVLLLDIWHQLGNTTVEPEPGWVLGIGQRLGHIWAAYRLHGAPECRATVKGGLRKPFYTITPEARAQLLAKAVC